MIEKEELAKALPLADNYKVIKIPKKKGRQRIISIPSPELKKIQRKILRYLKFCQPWVGSSYIFGLYKGSYVDHARKHANSRWVFQFDLKDAFSSVKKDIVKRVLHNEIYWDICFRHPQKYAKWFGLDPESPYILDFIERSDKSERLADELTELILPLTTFKGTLPQGAPTSPILFYLALTSSGIIHELSEIYRQKCIVSCYVDGFAVSGFRISSETEKKILECVEKTGFRVNANKTHNSDCRQAAHLIAGIRVDGLNGNISLPKKHIRKWRGIIHRATYETDPIARKKLEKRIKGFIDSLKPIYGENLPPQIKEPYMALQYNKPA